MDWIKVKTVHILDEYTDLSDVEFRVWIKIMALMARLEHEPSKDQIAEKKINPRTLKSLENKLNQHRTSIDLILTKVREDIEKVLRDREYSKNKKQEYRAVKVVVQPSVHIPVQPSVQQQRRVDKRRVDKNIYRGFSPPDVNVVSSYCKERKNNVNAQTFVDHYTSNGWMIGKNKMKDWKAAIRTWEQRGGDDGRGGARNSGGRPGVSTTPPEWTGTLSPISDEERAANLARLKALGFGVDED